jgi:hypothetical protein
MEAQLEAENENYKNLIESLEQGVFTLENNLSEVETRYQSYKWYSRGCTLWR